VVLRVMKVDSYARRDVACAWPKFHDIHLAPPNAFPYELICVLQSVILHTVERN